MKMPENASTIIGTLQQIAAKVPPTALPYQLPRETKGLQMEEVILVYCVGQGTFSEDSGPDHAQINLMMDMYDFHGNWVGFQQGVHVSDSTPADLLTTPPPPPAPFNQPSPVPRQTVKEWTKGIWTFADGSSVYAVGPAQSHLVPFKDGSFLFMVTTSQVLAGGTGRYEGCVGIKNATGTTHVPAGLLQSGKFPTPGLQFTARTIETFRIALQPFVQPLPPPGGEGGGKHGGKHKERS
jgi:hypothetical protein